MIYEITSAAESDVYSVESDKRLALTFVYRGSGSAALSRFASPDGGLTVFVK
jgi:hypothetical protein